MSSLGISAVEAYTTELRKLLARANIVKANGEIEPALTIADFEGGTEDLRKLSASGITANNQTHYAAIETACRNKFHDLLASTSIDDPSFSEIWNILDIVLILSDIEHCEPSLVFWLVEELLDSQTLDGCRTVFDYLDSRRERMTAKHFKKKELIILRSCNELLRRLSRAEDTVFCGRVFIFLFQSFPLGDKSSVNLRGEYHVENITTYEKTISAKQEERRDGEKKVGEDAEGRDTQTDEVSKTLQEPGRDKNKVTKQSDAPTKADKLDSGFTHEPEAVPDMDTLYPMFWSLQDSFSTPTKLFDSSHFRSFKGGLEATMRKFKAVLQELQDRGSTKLLDESKRGLKRKRSHAEDELSSSFNPKYLTSRDLFDLEMSDLAFRRHILVQALIVIDFLLSLTPKAKKKIDHTTNKSVLYNYTVSDDDANWATHTRSEIAAYLQQGPEGKFYYRMVDTVLSRDKNWVHWKAEGCPLIERVPVSAQDFAEAKKGAQKACQNKRLRPTPLGSLDLTFLSDGEDTTGLEKLKNPERYTIPAAESFRAPIAEDELDLEMAKTDEEKLVMSNARASKLWRTLRIASKSKLNLFDKIDDGNNLKALFQPEGVENNINSKANCDGVEEGGQDAALTEAEQIAVPESGLEAPYVPDSVIK